MKKKRLALSSGKYTIDFIERNNTKHHDAFYCLSCLHLFATKNKLGSYKQFEKRNIFVELICQLKKVIYWNLIITRKKIK